MNKVHSKSTIFLLGDAILDNFSCLDDKQKDLKKEIIDLGYNVINYAVDEMKVNDLLNGIIPKEIYVKSRTYPYPVDKDGKMYPIRLFAKGTNVNRSFTSAYGEFRIGSLIDQNDSDNMVVISMGGNDIQANFRKILFGVEYFINAILTKDFISDYQKVIESIRNNCKKILLVSVYLPYLGNGSSYGIYSPLSKPVIEKWNNFLNKMAKQYNIPILDLSRTVDIGNRSHYGTKETHPSNLTSKCMAECIAYIHSHYNGYHVYYAKDLNYNNITIE